MTRKSDFLNSLEYTMNIHCRYPKNSQPEKIVSLVTEIYNKSRSWHIDDEEPFRYIPRKMKFSNLYSREEIIQIFSELDWKVTYYKQSAHHTMVHFEPISDSE